jgi:hypothetical protein
MESASAQSVICHAPPQKSDNFNPVHTAACSQSSDSRWIFFGEVNRWPKPRLTKHDTLELLLVRSLSIDWLQFVALLD